MNELEPLSAACAGDEAAYGRLIEPYRRLLQAHCRRMLGSVPDAEDAVQETLLRAWRKLSRFEGRSSVRSWLYMIATNVCLRMIERRPRWVLAIDYGPPSDPHDPLGHPHVEMTQIEPDPGDRLALEDPLAGPEACYEQRETLELSFVVALQLLPPRQRAVVILGEVLGFSGNEVANALDTTPAAVYSGLQRAHEIIDHSLPDRSQQTTLQSLGDERLREIVGRYVEAWERSDVDTLVTMLTEDATLAMPRRPTRPQPRQDRGRATRRRAAPAPLNDRVQADAATVAAGYLLTSAGLAEATVTQTSSRVPAQSYAVANPRRSVRAKRPLPVRSTGKGDGSCRFENRMS